MEETFKTGDAARLWAVKPQRIQRQLIRDRRAGRNLYGSEKIDGIYSVTREYMEEHYGRQKNSR